MKSVNGAGAGAARFARVLLLPVVFWVVAVAGVRLVIVPPEECGAADPAGAREAARRAADWIVRGQQPDGRYTYEYFADERRAGSDYNIVRHAGVTLSLYEAAGRLGDAEAMAAAERGLAWMLAHLVRQDDWIALSDDDSASLGAAALMTAALAERRLATGDTRYDAEMVGLGHFIVKLQRPDGGFAIQWFLSSNQPDTVNTSIYYPGEALWALALLHGAFPNGGFDRAAWAAADFITLRRDEVEHVKWPPLNDHWASYGMAEMATWGTLADHHIAYARRLAGRFSLFMRAEAQNQADSTFDSLRGDERRAASLGTWVEGMAALWRLAEADPRLADIRDEIRTRAVCGAGILMARQYPPETGPQESGAWFEGGVTRMDDQQHAISGLLYTADAIEGRTRRAPDTGTPAP